MDAFDREFTRNPRALAWIKIVNLVKYKNPKIKFLKHTAIYPCYYTPHALTCYKTNNFVLLYKARDSYNRKFSS